MDTIRVKAKASIWRKYWYVAIGLILIIAIYLFKGVLGNASFVVEKNVLVIATVKQGNFRL